MEMDKTIRDLKLKGFALYYKLQKETNEAIDEVRQTLSGLLTQQEAGFARQDKILTDRIEMRLEETQDIFFEKC